MVGVIRYAPPCLICTDMGEERRRSVENMLRHKTPPRSISERHGIPKRDIKMHWECMKQREEEVVGDDEETS
jgi:hypothetical protein